MKPNRFKQLIADGKVPVGHMLFEFGTRSIAQMLDVAGADFVIIDMEHTGFTVANVADLLAWFKATTVAPFVRVPQVQYHFIARVLDSGALGVMVPNVKNAAEARTIVEAAKYHPSGRRGLIIGDTHTGFKKLNPTEFMAYSNENTTIICQIESRAGLDNLEQIAATPGVDVLWVGHGDLAQSLGIPGQFHHDRFLETLKLVVETANKYSLRAGIQPDNLAQAQEWMEMGFNVISYSGDTFVYIEAMTQAVTSLREFAGD